jgi:FkbM family methyltransferase
MLCPKSVAIRLTAPIFPIFRRQAAGPPGKTGDRRRNSRHIRQNNNRPERAAEQEKMMDALARSPGSPDVVVTYHGVEVLAAPHLSPRMIDSMSRGRYERREVACGLAAIPEGARILELGAGSGVVGAVLAKNTKPAAMLSIEANPFLIDHITRLYAHNGLSNLISVRHAVVLTDPKAPRVMEFFVQNNFLGSGLVSRKAEKATKVSVPVLGYETLKAAFPHDVIMMDIEGGELDFLRHADLTGVHTFIAEVHKDIYGREGVQEVRSLMVKAGFALSDSLSKVGVHVYKRDAA